MDIKYNASSTQKGFNYQNYCALYFFVNNVKDIKSLNDEGTDDFDIVCVDNKRSFFQVKEVANNNSLRKQRIDDSLKTLSNDYQSCIDNRKDVKELGIITNTDKPFGAKTNDAFKEPYMKFSYNYLSPKEKEKIDKSAMKYNVLDDNFLGKLTMTRIIYEGMDNESKQQELIQSTREFINRASIYKTDVRSLINEWIYMFTNNAENPSIKVTKEEFISHTEMIALDKPDFNKFFDTFDDDIDEEYVQNEYHESWQKIYRNFAIRNAIESSFDIFKKNNIKMKRKDRIVNFTNKYYEKAMKLIGLNNNNNNIGIAKLIVWLIISQSNICKTIQKEFNVDN